MTSSVGQLVNEYEAAARRLTELHRCWGWIVLLQGRRKLDCVIARGAEIDWDQPGRCPYDRTHAEL